MPWVGLCFVIVAFPGHIHLFFVVVFSMQRFNGISRISKAYAFKFMGNCNANNPALIDIYHTGKKSKNMQINMFSSKCMTIRDYHTVLIIT